MIPCLVFTASDDAIYIFTAASTKMVYCIALHCAGFLGGVLAFALWSIPAAAGMYGFSRAVASIGERLPNIVYSFLSGLNASTVGIVAVAAVQLSERAITDPLTRLIITFTAGAGMLYKALWYFPLLMMVSGAATVTWDIYGGQAFAKRVQRKWNALKIAIRHRASKIRISRENQSPGDIELNPQSQRSQEDVADDFSPPVLISPPATADVTLNLTQKRVAYTSSIHSAPLSTPPRTPPNIPASIPELPDTALLPQSRLSLSMRSGLAIVAAFFISFITLIALRGALHSPPTVLKLFTNLYLAGTIIFGGGPVVIPLLRDYIVTEGWVSSRDFLLGLAVIQAFPGPNFNFAVYLAALASKHTTLPSVVTAFLGFVAIFTPGKHRSEHMTNY